jgi:hypothetical protein
MLIHMKEPQHSNTEQEIQNFHLANTCLQQNVSEKSNYLKYLFQQILWATSGRANLNGRFGHLSN